MNKTTSPQNFTTSPQNSTLKQVEIDQLRDLHYKLSLIRDREDCPENIVEMIDEIRYSEFFNSINDEEL